MDGRRSEVHGSTCLLTVHTADTATPVVGERLEDILDGCIEKQKVDLDTDLGNHLTKEECLSRLTHYVAPTLPHLLALLFHTPESFPAKNVGLIVVDSISVPIDNAYPRTVDEKLRRAKNETSRWVSGRRQAVISDMANRLAKLAALRHLAILVTSNMITKVRVDREALLCPAIASQDWENAVTRRVCLYRDWIPRSKEHGSSRGGAVVEAGRLARGAGKGAGTGTVADPVPYAVAFEIGKSGIREVCLCREDVPVVHTPTNNAAGGASAGASRKRRRDDATDSDDSTHEYGWEENDDDFAAEELIDASFV